MSCVKGRWGVEWKQLRTARVLYALCVCACGSERMHRKALRSSAMKGLNTHDSTAVDWPSPMRHEVGQKLKVDPGVVQRQMERELWLSATCTRSPDSLMSHGSRPRGLPAGAERHLCSAQRVARGARPSLSIH